MKMMTEKTGKTGHKGHTSLGLHRKIRKHGRGYAEIPIRMKALYVVLPLFNFQTKHEKEEQLTHISEEIILIRLNCYLLHAKCNCFLVHSD